MEFTDHIFTVDVAGEQVPLRITADALHVFWGADTGPQTAEGLVSAYHDTIGTIAAEKILADDWTDGEIVINAMDIEG